MEDPMTQLNFGGLESSLSGFDNSSVLIWPVPFEKTVSYGHGTSEGPAAIIDASRHMEIYDEEIGGETAEIGIHTLAAMDSDPDPQDLLAPLQAKARKLSITRN